MGLFSKSSSSAYSFTQVSDQRNAASDEATAVGAGATYVNQAPDGLFGSISDLLAASQITNLATLETAGKLAASSQQLAGASVSALGDQRAREVGGSPVLERAVGQIAVAVVAGVIVSWLWKA